MFHVKQDPSENRCFAARRSVFHVKHEPAFSRWRGSRVTTLTGLFSAAPSMMGFARRQIKNSLRHRDVELSPECRRWAYPGHLDNEVTSRTIVVVEMSPATTGYGWLLFVLRRKLVRRYREVLAAPFLGGDGDGGRAMWHYGAILHAPPPQGRGLPCSSARLISGALGLVPGLAIYNAVLLLPDRSSVAHIVAPKTSPRQHGRRCFT
jgi:hypothetical protein